MNSLKFTPDGSLTKSSEAFVDSWLKRHKLPEKLLPKPEIDPRFGRATLKLTEALLTAAGRSTEKRLDLNITMTPKREGTGIDVQMRRTPNSSPIPKGSRDAVERFRNELAEVSGLPGMVFRYRTGEIKPDGQNYSLDFISSNDRTRKPVRSITLSVKS